MSQPRPYSLLTDPLYYGIVAFFAMLTATLPVVVGSGWFLTLAQTATLWLLALVAWRKRNLPAVIRLLAIWVAVQAITFFVMTLVAPTQAEWAVGNGFAYREALLEWMYTGSPLPASWYTQPGLRLLELAGIGVGSFASGGLLGVLFLTKSVNLMALGAAAAWQSADSLAPLMWGVQPWAWLRFAGYVLLVATLALPGYTGQYWPGGWPPRHRRAALIGLALLLAALAVEMLAA